MDFRDSCLTNAVFESKIALCSHTLQSTDFSHLILCELYFDVPFATDMRAVDQTIRLVFNYRLPRQVFGTDASLVSLAAGVGAFMFRRWRCTVNEFANIAWGDQCPSIDPNCSVAFRVLPVRPSKAIRAIVGKDDFLNETAQFSGRFFSTERIAMFEKSLVMTSAKALAMKALAAIRNRA
ncbi:hypothetical protein [Rhizobium mongolense]